MRNTGEITNFTVMVNDGSFFPASQDCNLRFLGLEESGNSSYRDIIRRTGTCQLETQHAENQASVMNTI